MSGSKRIVMLAAAALFAVWLTVHWGRVTGDADAFIRFTLGVIFAALVILRRKGMDEQARRIPDWIFGLSLAVGVLAALGGIIFRVHMIEWAGVLLLLFACSFWVAPTHFRMDLGLAFAVLFWVHPLPGQVFSWIQGLMQRLSVIGSEVVLHVLNVRVWGDGIVLRAGYQNFLVPESCSGMRTSVTVFLCALGVGLLLRLRWWETLGFIVLGLAQVLILNIARISYLVLWSPRMPKEWAENFLHDSLGVFLMGAIVLVQFEAVWWHWWSRRRAYIREGIRKKDLEGPDKASIIPHSLRRLALVTVVLVGVGMIGLGIFAILYKSRAYHRKEMIREVAEGLMETDPASAFRAIVQIRSYFPADTALLVLQANTDFVLGRFEAGLALLDEAEQKGGALGLREVIMKGWALMRAGRLAEARALVNAMPAVNDRLPGVAMLKAEFAAMDGLPAEASRHLLAASASHLLLPRIRALFPYLAQHEQWQAIAAADHDRPYAELHQALIALHANQQVNNLSGLIRVMGQALKRWPDDPRLQAALFEIASRRQGGEWEAHFDRNFRSNAGRLAADPLSAAAGYSWRLLRPDLAWLAYVHMARIEPDDPELLMAPARYGQVWTRVRRHQIAVPSASADLTVDLAPLLNLFAKTRPLGDFRRRIPALDEAVGDGADRNAAKRLIERGLAELAKRETAGPLGERYMRLFPMTLAMLNRFDEAHERLDRFRELHPEREAEVLFQHAVFYDQQAEWQKSYEKLREYRQLQSSPNLTVELLRISALMNLNLGACAMQVLQDARVAFPGAVRLDLAESAIWDVFGYKDQALHVLMRSPAGGTSPVAVGLLYATGRLSEARRLSEALGFGAPDGSDPVDPPMALPPATYALTPRWPPPPDEKELDGRIEELRNAQEKAFSPFIRALRGLSMEWAQARRREVYVVADAAQAAALTARWEAAGRTPLEAAGALYELAMLAARQQDDELAKVALRRVLELLPMNAPAWRALTALSTKDPATVRAAAMCCPRDPEIFLAELVTLVDGSEDEARWEAVEKRVVDAVAGDTYSPETLIRAGDFLLARGKPQLAAKLVRAALPQTQGLLAAHVLALRTALMLGDADWALASAVSGIEQARDPVPFYRVMVELKVARRQTDNDLLAALEYLNTHQREDPRWAAALGALYFQKGDMGRALTVFGSVIDEDIKGVQVRTLLLAAEAARLDAKSERAVRILEAAYAQQPEQVGVLNNLVYLLAQNPNTLPRARALLPKLLELGGEKFAVMDTAAMVALRSGDTAQAELWMDKALSLLADGEYAVQEVRLNAAEVKIRSGNAGEARAALDELRRDPERSDFVDQRARLLLREIDVMEGGGK
jgi:exosortase/archaeosortase family protein